MFMLRPPNTARLDRLLAAHERRQLSYRQVGESLHSEAPVGAFVNEGRALLGQGAAVYAQARQALATWQMFPSGWLRAYTREAEAAAGNVVATVARCAGVWVVNTCRVVYVHEEREARRDGNQRSQMESLTIGYGTLSGHLMRGEERFRVAWHRADDSVWYDVWSFSWPDRWLARCALPLIRGLQRRFAVESGVAMQAAVRGQPPT